MLTVNGRVRLCRVRWHSVEEGSQTPTDQLLDEADRAISEGLREMACRLNREATGFQQTSENLARAAHLTVSKETLRQLIAWPQQAGGRRSSLGLRMRASREDPLSRIS